MRFEATTRTALTANEPALLLSMMEGQLVGGLVRKRADGRFEERAIYTEGSIILALQEIPQLQNDEATVKVIIDKGAYWPPMFPPLKRPHEIKKQTVLFE